MPRFAEASLPAYPPRALHRGTAEPILIDFSSPYHSTLNLHHGVYVRHGGVTVSRCILPPNPGLAIGSAQFTVAIHESAPFDMEWRQPGKRKLERRRILGGDAHVNAADRPIYQQWSTCPTILLIALDAEFIRQIEREMFDTEGVRLETHIGVRDPILKQMAEAWRQELKDGGPGGRLFTESLASLMAVHLLRTYGDGRPALQPVKGGLALPRLKRVLDYIEGHLDDDLRLDELAGIAGLSPHHFGGAFKAATGKPPHRYLTERRILRAKELLLDHRRAIASIALEVGFANQSHLTDSFRKVTGTTPLRYRLQAS